jgi:hypothetical protein
MPYERTGYAPWSLTREAGVESATVDGTIQVPQYVYPNLDTGFIDEKGVWQGRKSSDRSFIGITVAEGIAHTADTLFPDTNNYPSIDMSGFNDILIALKPSSAGNYEIKAVMGPDTVSFANLSPVNAAATLKIVDPTDRDATDAVIADTAESLGADVWNIFNIQGRASNQKNMQFKIVNNTGAISNIEFGFMRLV